MKKITIFEDNAVAGEGMLRRLESGDYVIEDCPAMLGDAIHMGDPMKEVDRIYSLIESSINSGHRALEHGGYLWTWNIHDSREEEVLG